MKSVSLFRVILSCVIGLVIGVIFTALVNLAIPATNLFWTLIPLCLAAVLSGILLGISWARSNKSNSYGAIRLIRSVFYHIFFQ